jgi:hypothetical protein
MADGSRLDTEARKYVRLRRDSEKKAAEAARAKEALDAQIEVIHELMDDLHQPSTVLELGGDIGRIRLTKPKPTIYGRIIDKDVAIASLEALGMTEEALDFEIRKAPVNEMIKGCLERGEELPDGFDFSESKRLTLTYLDKK